MNICTGSVLLISANKSYCAHFILSVMIHINSNIHWIISILLLIINFAILLIQNHGWWSSFGTLVHWRRNKWWNNFKTYGACFCKLIRATFFILGLTWSNQFVVYLIETHVCFPIVSKSVLDPFWGYVDCWGVLLCPFTFIAIVGLGYSLWP